MHITIVANGFQEDYIYNLVNHLADKVDRLDFIGSPIYHRKKLSDKIFFYEFRPHQEQKGGIAKAIGTLKYYKKLLSHLLHSQSPVVHLQWVRFSFLEGVLLTWIIKRMGKRVFYTAHNVLPHDSNSYLTKLSFRWLYLMQDEIFVHTSFIKDRIVKDFNLSPKRLHVVPHGVYQKELNPVITRTSARAALNLPQDSIVLLFFGIIQAYKGFDTLVEGVKLLGENRNVQVLAAGRLAKEYEAEFKSLVERTESTNYSYILRFLSEEEVEKCFKAADVTVLPYKEASQSGVLFMSYTYGVPVIAPSLGGFPEDILPSKTGYLFEPNSPQSLAASIQKCIAEWSQAGQQERQLIRDFARDNYSWDSSCSKI